MVRGGHFGRRLHTTLLNIRIMQSVIGLDRTQRFVLAEIRLRLCSSLLYHLLIPFNTTIPFNITIPLEYSHDASLEFYE